MFQRRDSQRKINRKWIQKGVCMLCIISLCLSSISISKAVSYTSGAITFRESDGCLVVTGYDASKNPDGTLNIEKTFKDDSNVMKVMGIDARVFEGQSFSSLNIKANNGMIIGSYAFLRAKVAGDLPSADISGGKVNKIGAYAFSEAEIDCDMSIDAIDGSIKEGAFKNAVINGTLSINGSIDTLAEYAFSGLSVKRIHMPETTLHIGDEALSNTKITSWIFSDSLKTLGSKVFDGCDKLASIKLPAGDSVEYVAADAFPDREGVTVIIPEGVTNLSIYHFENYHHLVFQVPENLLENSAVIRYLKKNNLAYKLGENGKVIVPDESSDSSGQSTPSPLPTPTLLPDVPEESTESPAPVETEEPDSFPEATPSQIPVVSGTPDSSTEETSSPIPAPTDEAESPAPVKTQTPGESEDGNPASVPTTAPSGSKEQDYKTDKKATYNIKNIQYKFQNKNSVMVMGATKKNFVQLKIPNTVTIRNRLYKVTSIKKNAFKGQRKLKKVFIGNYVKVIEDQSFAGCKNLHSIQFGTNVVTLGKKVLYQDKKLKKIVFKGTKLKKIGKQTFSGVPRKVDIRAVKSKVRYYAKLINRSKT